MSFHRRHRPDARWPGVACTSHPVHRFPARPAHKRAHNATGDRRSLLGRTSHRSYMEARTASRPLPPFPARYASRTPAPRGRGIAGNSCHGPPRRPNSPDGSGCRPDPEGSRAIRRWEDRRSPGGHPPVGRRNPRGNFLVPRVRMAGHTNRRRAIPPRRRSRIFSTGACSALPPAVLPPRRTDSEPHRPRSPRSCKRTPSDIGNQSRTRCPCSRSHERSCRESRPEVNHSQCSAGNPVARSGAHCAAPTKALEPRPLPAPLRASRGPRASEWR